MRTCGEVTASAAVPDCQDNGQSTLLLPGEHAYISTFSPRGRNAPICPCCRDHCNVCCDPVGKSPSCSCPGPARAGLAGGAEAVLRADRAARAAGGGQRLCRQGGADHNPLLDDPIFRRFFGVPGQQPEQMQRSLGSGVMVDPSGLVVTNVHVIEGADEVKVSLSDKREFEAEIVLKDPPQRSGGIAARRTRMRNSRRWISPIPMNCRSATSCWRSAIPSASGRP